jgi:16S rRNA (uracil1498-N3)-methyltransferase
MNARFYTDIALVTGSQVTLPDQAARHVQVLRLQPGDAITLFNGLTDCGEGEEGEFSAIITRMGRSDVDVTIGAYTATQREAPRAVHLVVGMPANERMDWLVEKATELGVASIQPVMSERSVLRLKADRADKKASHWRGVATAASEQCGRSRVPVIHDVATLGDWLKTTARQNGQPDVGAKLLLSLRAGTLPLAQAVVGSRTMTFLSGPEGGLSPSEEAVALACGFVSVTLGTRVLRAETAPLACLSFAALMSPISGSPP